MQIQRIRRLKQSDEAELCDFCDQSLEKGYEFSGEDVGGPRSGTFLRVCDDCLSKTRKSSIGFLVEPKQRQWTPEEIMAREG